MSRLLLSCLFFRLLLLFPLQLISTTKSHFPRDASTVFDSSLLQIFNIPTSQSKRPCYVVTQPHATESCFFVAGRDTCTAA
ncbi:uncharacterized protein SETTUDRAFT_166523 [Exserohilum turcica Et28A]|uniref:Secreted protein n=1 Tax=Exserohilum turcicum (strain 28A) TaxID=671987 RepID=R0I6G9_EXST2|nr:uncharacterized protein SETTUDRAFT_166523 [Exserohilum turcica Et28A]EOA81185.1 hypothetical protein SETTUDRAFT_166523 [Exserohilum turcica Et28A]